nr:hypothetical protein [Enterococcus faecalis]
MKPLNAEQGLLLTLSDEPLLIGDWHYIKATATITDGIIKKVSPRTLENHLPRKGWMIAKSLELLLRMHGSMR